MSFWSSQLAADYYAKGRPYFHPSVIFQVAEYLRDAIPFERAIDIGCGTGLSTVALKQIASDVCGIDISPEMLRHAPPNDALTFLVASGEAIPFEDESFDLISLSQSFHWLDRSRFFAEARRVLRPGGWIVIYDNYFSALMQENENFQPWFAEYLKRFPTPPRPKVQFTEEDARSEGFNFQDKAMHEEWPEFTRDSLIAYLFSQSNISAAIERGDSIDEIRNWMEIELSQFLPAQNIAHIAFGSPIWYLQKAV
ncbi:MAG TPA: class I SAM-dependent methyltransferase [Candidatus Kapabacteria bacterium]|jgi:SAM-dependent methyltransferase|nr:class I SAM-dependent methyltransferase [Candidatus Kapabacteria bacterium]